MTQLKTPNFWIEHAKKIFFIFFAAITNAIALNNFLIPANIYASGINGIAQLISGILDNSSGIIIDTGILILVFIFILV